jgi:hypothetical protein
LNFGSLIAEKPASQSLCRRSFNGFATALIHSFTLGLQIILFTPIAF